ncbi:MAG: RNB domain-containing ribonuclease, partial [Kiritimatiellae bacterium]|nr:RNB domain-containing ribonuclease [Kiritimatiellia bacterium]
WTAVPLVPFGGRMFHVADPAGAGEGDRVVVRFSSWDNPHFDPDAVVAAVIGPADNPSLDTLAIEREYGLPGPFPPDVDAEAQRVSALLSDPAPREDLRGETIVTIDPATAKDFDDALSLSTDGQGRRVLGVHIADVSHFVRPGSALDAEARKRGTSVYLVDRVIPMLPEQLSNGVCSLVQGEDRLAFSAFLTFDASGAMVGRRFAKSVIRSSRRMTYGEALEIIERSAVASSKTQDARRKTQDGNPSCDLRPTTCDAAEGGLRPATCDHAVADLVRDLHSLSQQLRRNRFARFSLDISSPELEVKLGPDGRMLSIGPAEHNVAHELVEEAMIAANEAVATELAYHRIPHLCRFHDVPDSEKMDALEAGLRALGIRTGALRDAGAIVRLLKAVRGTPLEYYVSMMVLKSMKRAEYSADEEGHFGLAKRYYSHFTSPIRRYPDLVLHRQLAALLAGDRAAQPSADELRAIARTSTQTEFRADQAERALVEIKKFRWLEERLAAGDPPELDGVVVKCLPFGAFVELPSLMVDGMAHVSTMSSHFVRFDRDRERLVAPGEFDLGPGSRVRVLVTAVHFDDRRIDFKITDFNPGSSTTEHTEHAEGRDAPVARPSFGIQHSSFSISSKDARHEARRARRGEGRAPARPDKAKPPKKGKGAKKPKKTIASKRPKRSR